MSKRQVSRMLVAVAVVVMILAQLPMAAQAAGTNYYVDSVNGRDRNNGLSESSAWQNLTMLYQNSFQPGDVIHLKRGSSWAATSWPNGIAFNSSGADGNPIRITPYGDGERPTIRAISSDWGVGIELNGSWVEVEGLLIASASHYGAWVSGNHNNLRDLEITDAGIGVWLKGSDNTLLNSYIHDLHMYRNTVGGDDDVGALGVCIEGSNAEVAYNRIINCQAPSYDYGTDGGAVEWWASSDNGYVHHNWAENNDGFMELGGGTVSNTRVAYNVSLNNSRFSVFQLQGTFASTVNNFRIENNTIVEDQARSAKVWNMFWFNGQPAGQVALRNNIVYARDFNTIAEADSYGWDLVHEHNLYYMPSGGELGFSPAAGEVVADPNFANLSGRDLTLAVNSQAINAGLSLGYNADMQGVAVPEGDAPDLGAFETPVAQPEPTVTQEPTVQPTPTQEPTVAPIPTQVPAPVISQVSPSEGATTGGTTVTVLGSGFAADAMVTFGSLPASSVSRISENELRAVAPAFVPSTVNVTVTSNDQSVTAANAYNYKAPEASVTIASKRVARNTQFVLPVSVANLQGLNTASMTLTYDPRVLQLVSVAPTGLLTGWTMSKTTANGQVTIVLTSKGTAASGMGQIVNVTFKAIGARRSKSTVTASQLSFNSGSIPTNVTSGTVTIR